MASPMEIMKDAEITKLRTVRDELIAALEGVLDAVPPDASANIRQTDNLRRIARQALANHANKDEKDGDSHR